LPDMRLADALIIIIINIVVVVSRQLSPASVVYPDDRPVGGGRRDNGEVSAGRVGRPEDGVRRRSSVDETA